MARGAAPPAGELIPIPGLLPARALIWASYHRSCGLSRSESVQPHAPNGLGRTGPRCTRPWGSDTDLVRGPIPGSRFPSRLGHVGRSRGDGEAPNHRSGGVGAPHSGALPGVPDCMIWQPLY